MVGFGIETFNRFECFQLNRKLHRRLGCIEFGLRFESLVEKKFNCKPYTGTN